MSVWTFWLQHILLLPCSSYMTLSLQTSAYIIKVPVLAATSDLLCNSETSWKHFMTCYWRETRLLFHSLASTAHSYHFILWLVNWKTSIFRLVALQFYILKTIVKEIQPSCSWQVHIKSMFLFMFWNLNQFIVIKLYLNLICNFCSMTPIEMAYIENALDVPFFLTYLVTNCIPFNEDHLCLIRILTAWGLFLFIHYVVLLFSPTLNTILALKWRAEPRSELELTLFSSR